MGQRRRLKIHAAGRIRYVREQVNDEHDHKQLDHHRDVAEASCSTVALALLVDVKCDLDTTATEFGRHSAQFIRQVSLHFGYPQLLDPLGGIHYSRCPLPIEINVSRASRGQNIIHLSIGTCGPDFIWPYRSAGDVSVTDAIGPFQG